MNITWGYIVLIQVLCTKKEKQNSCQLICPNVIGLLLMKLIVLNSNLTKLQARYSQGWMCCNSIYPLLIYLKIPFLFLSKYQYTQYKNLFVRRSGVSCHTIALVLDVQPHCVLFLQSLHITRVYKASKTLTTPTGKLRNWHHKIPCSITQGLHRA